MKVDTRQVNHLTVIFLIFLHYSPVCVESRHVHINRSHPKAKKSSANRRHSGKLYNHELWNPVPPVKTVEFHKSYNNNSSHQGK